MPKKVAQQQQRQPSEAGAITPQAQSAPPPALPTSAPPDVGATAPAEVVAPLITPPKPPTPGHNAGFGPMPAAAAAVKYKQEHAPKKVADAKAYTKSFAKADDLAAKSEANQRMLRAKLRKQRERTLEVEAKVDSTSRRLMHHKKHQATIEKSRTLTQERNARGYIYDTQRFLSTKIAKKVEGRNVLAKKLQATWDEKASLAAQQQRISLEDGILKGNLVKERKEEDHITSMIKMEDGLAKAVRASQADRLNAINMKLSSDRIAEAAERDKVAIETTHENKVAMKLANMVTKERQLDSKVAQIDDKPAATANEVAKVAAPPYVDPNAASKPDAPPVSSPPDFQAGLGEMGKLPSAPPVPQSPR